jgi:nucleoside-diphosphate-sugar epimerase
MNILILGATGFVGSTVTQLILEEGFNVTCAGRNIEAIKQQFPQARFLYCDFLKDTIVDNWLPRLKGIHAIVNCVGIFYHKNKSTIWNIHYHSAKALYQAAQLNNIKQIIHLSALGIDDYCNEYANSKRAIEDFLKSLSIPHVILRPSIIYGAQSGGSMDALKRLASYPGVIPLPGDGEQLFQPIYVGDLSTAIKNLLITPPTNSSLTLAAVSSQKSTIKEILVIIRQWLRFNKGLFIKIPFFLIQMIGKLGDVFSLSILNKQSIDMLKQGNYTSEQEVALFQEITQVIPLDFASGLKQIPAAQEERWYIRFLLLRPFLKLSLAIMWILSALTSILPYAKYSSYGLLNQLSIAPTLQPLLLYGASCLNALLGFSLLVNYKIKINCVIQLLVILLYSLIITIYLPQLWLEPFGPIVKNIPILVGVCALYIMES